MKLGKHMHVHPVGTDRKETYVVEDSKGRAIGYIEWYARWRQYVFNAESDAIFSHDCLSDLSTFCKQISKA